MKLLCWCWEEDFSSYLICVSLRLPSFHSLVCLCYQEQHNTYSFAVLGVWLTSVKPLAEKWVEAFHWGLNVFSRCLDLLDLQTVLGQHWVLDPSEIGAHVCLHYVHDLWYLMPLRCKSQGGSSSSLGVKVVVSPHVGNVFKPRSFGSPPSWFSPLLHTTCPISNHIKFLLLSDKLLHTQLSWSLRSGSQRLKSGC